MGGLRIRGIAEGCRDRLLGPAETSSPEDAVRNCDNPRSEAVARTELVHNALSQLIVESTGLTAIAPLWALLYRKIGRARTIRNAVAHGTPHTLNINGKN